MYNVWDLVVLGLGLQVYFSGLGLWIRLWLG